MQSGIGSGSGLRFLSRLAPAPAPAHALARRAGGAGGQAVGTGRVHGVGRGSVRHSCVISVSTRYFPNK